MRAGWSASRVSGACLALLLGCGEEREPPFAFPTGGASAVGGSPTAGAGGGVADGCGVHEQRGSCVTDALPAAVPVALVGDITAQVMSDGCGKDYGFESAAKRTLLTQGTKAPNCVDKVGTAHECGDWTVRRDFYVYMPVGYDSNKADPLVIEAPGCGGNGRSVLSLAAKSIRVGVSPGPTSTGDPTGQPIGCFDDAEGDDSIDWFFYEHLYDTLNTELCFDRRRVFVYGLADGGAFASQLGCRYGSDAVRPVRGVLVQDESFREPKYQPTCNQSAVAQMWVVHDNSFATDDFHQAKPSIARAMVAAQCFGKAYEHAQLENFPIGGGHPDDLCQHIVGCDPLYPLVVCPVQAAGQRGLDDVALPGLQVFTRLFSTPSFTTP